MDGDSRQADGLAARLRVAPLYGGCTGLTLLGTYWLGGHFHLHAERCATAILLRDLIPLSVGWGVASLILRTLQRWPRSRL